MAQQAAVLNTNTRYLHPNIVRFAERLLAFLPGPLQVCFFVCSGSEANELALRLARAATGEEDMIVVDGAYHGNTAALIDISPYKHNGPGGHGPPDWVHTAPEKESVIGLFKTEVIERLGPWRGREHVELETLEWVSWFNNRRLLGPLGDLPPAEFEAAFFLKEAQPEVVALN